MTRKALKRSITASNQREAAVAVVAAKEETDLKANAEADAEVIVPRVNAVRVRSAVEVSVVKAKSAVVAEVVTVETAVAVEEADLELLFQKVKLAQLLNVLNAVVKERDSKADLGRKLTHSIVRMALVAADVATRRAASARATGVKRHLSQKKVLSPPLKVKFQLRPNLKEERESQEKKKSRHPSLLRRKSDSLSMTT